ncbi:amidase [Kordiimonas aestuarii]|uniref:amidase n=1 Tax=Kordiimonas aestuarii TaxID=1005925 RepID=UPI0021D020DB|nr:amidase [Kordiimonas aestuarii]
MAKLGMDRRQILKGAGILGGIAAARAAYAYVPETPNPPVKTPADLAIAERIAGVSYTPDERAMILDELEDMLDRLRRRRAGVTLRNSDAPAMAFDPRLPGKTYVVQSGSVQLASEAPGPLPNDEAVAFAPVHAQAYWIKNGLLTSSRLTDIYLSRIKRLDPKLKSFITVTEAVAREQAREADVEIRSGRYRGPLHGIPFGMKDIIDTKGIKTTWGAAPYQDRTAESDAAVTKRLRDAGAVLLGKVALGALAYGDLWFGGVVRNPWNLNEGASGSSAGSASATVAALCSFAIGTETMGSIISPSARCGAVGLRPTFGRVPRTGAMALCWSLDKIGPICRSVEDTALVLEAINGHDAGDPGSLDWGFAYDGKSAAAGDIRIGYDPKWFTGEDATDLDRQVLDQLKSMGFALVEIALPKLPYSTLLTTVEVEAAAAFEGLTLSDEDDRLMWQGDKAWPNTLRAARFHSAIEYVQLDRFRRQVMEMMHSMFDQVDMFACPNFAGDMLVITNYTGHPSLSLPLGLIKRQTFPLTGTEDKKLGFERRVPYGFTLWGNMFREDQLIGVGRLLERAANFGAHRPALLESLNREE